MPETLRVGIIVGSLRAGSYSRQVARELVAAAPATLTFEWLEIGDLPLYNADLESDLPPAWARFREEVTALDGVLFVTPEYNRSIPAALKNAIDVASRPSGQNRWNGKPAAIASVTTGALGAFGANHHLRQALVFVNMPAMPQPELYVGRVTTLLDESGKLVNEDTRALFRKFMDAFSVWVHRFTTND